MTETIAEIGEDKTQTDAKVTSDTNAEPESTSAEEKDKDPESVSAVAVAVEEQAPLREAVADVMEGDN